MSLRGDDQAWSVLTDAYGITYDPRTALTAAARGDDEAFAEIWERLHHQGDLGTASYAAVPILVDHIGQSTTPNWRPYALVATIEETRHQPQNPVIPRWLEGPYQAALQRVVEPALQHLRDAGRSEEVRSIIAVLAHAKRERTLGTIALWTEDERQEALGEI